MLANAVCRVCGGEVGPCIKGCQRGLHRLYNVLVEVGDVRIVLGLGPAQSSQWANPVVPRLSFAVGQVVEQSHVGHIEVKHVL